jgi:uncharacterized protein (DUF2252 family)
MLDPNELALRQLARDRGRSKRFPWLGDRKLVRMSRSPLAYLRGSAELFYEALEIEPSLAKGPPGEGWLVGDLHLENFGAYRVESDAVVFGLNDFDEAFIGPHRLDLLRLVTSLILGGRTMGFDGRRALELGRHLLEAYAAVVAGSSRLSPRPAPIERLIAKVETRSRRALLDGRTVARHGTRKFRRGERYVDLPTGLAKEARRAFVGYASALGLDPESPALEIIDLAFRIAGTGSLGTLRIAVLVRGKGGRDGAWVYDLKEEAVPACGPLARKVQRTKAEPARRILRAMTACLDELPKQAGAGHLGRSSLVVRRLSPQEDKLDLRRLDAEELEPLARHLGGIVGRAHAKGATSSPKKKKKQSWSAADVSELLDRATALAGLHEAAYLAMCRNL